jgi:hypothetical protein
VLKPLAAHLVVRNASTGTGPSGTGPSGTGPPMVAALLSAVRSSTKRALSECCLPPAGAVCVLPRAARCADDSRRRSIARRGIAARGPNVG